MGFLVALQFLTAVPTLTRREPEPRELGQAMAYYSLVGLLLGAVLGALHFGLFGLLPTTVVAALVVAAWVLLTGGLHLDGLMDVCDGVLSQPDAERRLAVMKDTRVGTYGVLGAVCILLLKFGLVLSFLPWTRLAALLLAPTLSRWAMVLATAAFPSARPTGLGAMTKAAVGWPQVGVSGVVALAAAFALGQWYGLTLLALVGIVTWLLGLYFRANLGGLTGDTYGAINEIIEVLVLTVVVSLPEAWWHGW